MTGLSARCQRPRRDDRISTNELDGAKATAAGRSADAIEEVGVGRHS